MGESVDKIVSVADPTIRAQVLDLDRWLIPQQHAEIPRFTGGNQVKALIDGKEAFLAMNAAFTSTIKDGYIYITDWDIVPEIHLLGKLSGKSSEVDTVLGSARGRSTDVRVLLWYVNAFNRTHDISLWESYPWANIFVDNKTRGVTGSLHQKTSAVKTPQGLISFVGGIDLTTDRWDTPEHLYIDPNADYEKGDEKPWHDVHARVTGPAAADIETNFRQRWNDRHSSAADKVPVHPAPAPIQGGPHIVQTLRTFPHHATAAFSAMLWHYDFAPVGEFGLRQAYVKAIGNARNFIYIEDQYMISDEVSTAIAAAMSRSKNLVVILTTAPAPDSPKKFINDAFDFHQTAFINRLRAVDATRVGLYDLANVKGTPIYCHAKICVIDDIWAIIGSCNMSQRSFTNDVEISIAVLDETIEQNRRKFARDLRIALWKEHLGLTPAELPLIDDPISGAAEWSKRAGKPPAQARVHVRPAGSDSSLWNSEIDPNGST